MKKIIWIPLIVMFSFFLFPADVLAAVEENGNWYEEIEKLIGEQLNDLNIQNWEPYLKYVESEEFSILEGESAKEMIRNLLTGQFSFTWQDFLNNVVRIFFRELHLNLTLMAKIIVIALICSIFRNFNDSFNNSSVGEIGYYVCYAIIIILLIQSFLPILAIGRTAIEKMSGFMQLLFPVLLGLLTAMGNFTSVTILQPAIAVLIGTVGSVLTNLVFPLISLSAVITMVNHVSERVQIQKLGKLLNNLCTWILAFIFTIFVGVLTIQGAMTSTFDGISIRTAKFAIGTFVPVVGKMFSESLDIIVGCSLLLKNAAGIAGLIIISLLCLAPAVKIFTLLFLYKLISALLEPVSDKRITECISGIAKVLSVLLITVLGIALMFFLTVTLMIGTGNTSMMLR
ncbi:MAG: stage III sporulation protein AE [Clostridia bacterium]|nr:stage III sporulation protein AE [Clostridia bacterium]